MNTLRQRLIDVRATLKALRDEVVALDESQGGELEWAYEGLHAAVFAIDVAFTNVNSNTPPDDR